MAQKLDITVVEKPWGKATLPPIFADVVGDKIGEIWYQGTPGQDLPLLVKYIFTSERLSIQVHPSDQEAQASGLPKGKEEAWYILDCEPDARLGIGLVRELTPEAFRAAAMDGSLEDLIDWKPVKPGDCYFIPAGTVHAIGAGITLAEVQQNADITYRIYDYGRPRELHLDQGLAVSHLTPYTLPPTCAAPTQAAALVSDVAAPFWLDLAVWQAGQDVTLPQEDRIWFTPLRGSGRIDGAPWEPGQCWLLDRDTKLTADVAASGLLAGERANAA
ncbi:MAG: class I mannose-6-phosphate isomerase [bacterium]|nr:class I mannose-6-phosphate isomerase [bacterium]